MEATIKDLGSGIIHAAFSGSINEQSIFPKLEMPISKIVLDLEKVPNLNSMGILYWIRWWKELKAKNSALLFEVHNIHMPLLSCASVVAGFLPDDTDIVSLYLPYFNELEGVSVESHLKKGVDYDDQTFKLPGKIMRTHQGQTIEFELDCVPSRDLRFLKQKIENI